MEESREFEIRDELREKRKNIKEFEDLVAFLKDVTENYNCGYGEAPRAMAQAILATGYYLCKEFGITGFQAGCVMWDFIRDWLYSHNQCGMKIVDYDDMLYPQYYNKFEKTISSDTWYALQKKAKENLEKDNPHTSPRVIAHWQSIVDGTVPFGYRIKKE